MRGGTQGIARRPGRQGPGPRGAWQRRRRLIVWALATRPKASYRIKLMRNLVASQECWDGSEEELVTSRGQAPGRRGGRRRARQWRGRSSWWTQYQQIVISLSRRSARGRWNNRAR